MRCLYCGKGLALLKRLRGGGEFCSDAHRLKYQEEYNQLALSRLLQAQPPEEQPGAPANGQNANGSAPVPQARKEQAPVAAASPAPAAIPSKPTPPITAPT